MQFASYILFRCQKENCDFESEKLDFEVEHVDFQVEHLVLKANMLILISKHFFFRQIFDTFENEYHLCRRFTVFVTKYNLMSKDNLIVPMLEDAATAVGESEA